MASVTLRVPRYDPDIDTAPRWVAYQVPFEEGMTVLMALQRANEIDGLTFRHSCRIGFCSLCLLVVNGKHKLACKTVIKDPSEPLTVEPVKRYPLIRDLVVDMGD